MSKLRCIYWAETYLFYVAVWPASDDISLRRCWPWCSRPQQTPQAGGGCGRGPSGASSGPTVAARTNVTGLFGGKRPQGRTVRHERHLASGNDRVGALRRPPGTVFRPPMLMSTRASAESAAGSGKSRASILHTDRERAPSEFFVQRQVQYSWGCTHQRPQYDGAPLSESSLKFRTSRRNNTLLILSDAFSWQYNYATWAGNN